MTQHFRVDVSDITRNLVISVSPLSGDPDVYVSRRSQNPGCYFPGDVTPNRWSANDFCFNYTWSSSSASIDVLVIQWNNPCASPPANASVCNAVVDWVPGPFYIGVFAYQASTFDITVYQSGAVSSLVNGQAQYASTNGYIPAYFVLPVPSSYIRPSIGFTVTAYATPQNTSVTTQPTGVQLYVVACHSGACSSQDQTPGPSHYTWGKFVTIAAGAASLFVVDMDPNYCDSSVGGVCNYFLGVYADTRCAYQGCAVNFQVQATITGGDAVKTISYDEINNTISLHSDFVPVNDLNSAARYEVWPGGVTAPPQLFFELDGCSGPSNAIPTLYLCTSACPIPSQPTWGNNSQAVVKVGAGAGASTQVFFNAPSDAMFAAVAAPYTRSEHNLRVLSEEMTILPHTPWRRQLAESQFLSMALGDGTSFTFSLTVASSSSLIQLWSPEKLVQLSAAPDAFDGRRVIGFEVSWTAPVLYNITSGGRVLVNSARPVGIQYTIYYAAGGFPPAVRSATACGLDQASQAENVQSQVLSTGTSWTADNLEPSTFYEVNVIAYCGPQCWNTTGLQSSSVLLGRYAYRAASFTTPAAAPTPTSPNTTIIVVVVVLVSLVIAAIVFAYYRKRKAARRVQYEMFEMSEAGGMYATSGDVYSAMD